MRQEIVLDKSYLQAASAGAIRNLCTTFRVIMPGALFFELLTGDPGERARCFAKLPRVLNPVELVEHVGWLLRYEIRKKKPSSSLYERRHRMLFTFNAGLAEPTFVVTPKQAEGIDSWKKQVEEEVANFRHCVSTTHHLFPIIEVASNRERPSVIKEIQCAIATNTKLVRRAYGSIRKRSFPRPALLDGRWAFFRRTQVHLLAALDHVSRYGIASDLAVARGLENEVADLEYRTMGVLAGAIATQDRRSQEVFRALRPDGLLVC